MSEVKLEVKPVESMTFTETQHSINDVRKATEDEVAAEMIEDQMGDGEYVIVNDSEEVQTEIEDAVTIEILNKEEDGEHKLVDLDEEDVKEVQIEIEDELANEEVNEPDVVEEEIHDTLVQEKKEEEVETRQEEVTTELTREDSEDTEIATAEEVVETLEQEEKEETLSVWEQIILFFKHLF